MALMGVRIDKRTLAGLASNGTVAFAHGLGGAPDVVKIRFIATLASNTNPSQINAPIDATNVTLQNSGAAAGSNMEVITMRFHSIIQ